MRASALPLLFRRFRWLSFRSDTVVNSSRNICDWKRIPEISLKRRHFAACITASQSLFSTSCTSFMSSASTNGRRDTCWNCSKNLTVSSKFFCEHCSTILPPPEINYFNVLDVNYDFDLSSEQLQKSLKDLQRLFHPDKFSLKSDKEKEISEQVSSLVNVAFFTLIDPLQRGIYILKLKGITIDEDTQMDDPEFLMEVMELNEEIAAAEDGESLVQLRERIKNEYFRLITSISNAFKKDSVLDAKNSLIKLRYFNNMTEKLRHLIPPS